MKVTGKIKRISLPFGADKFEIVLSVNERREVACNADELLKEGLLDIEIKKRRKKRSLSANAYAWALMDKLAEKTGIEKEKIYKNIIRNIGGNAAYVKVANEACEKLCSTWNDKGLGWCTEVIGTDKGFTEVALYYGSSSFDTKQMSRLIELVIQECNEQDISTETLEKAAYWEGLLGQ